jgi:hypothetical protein
MAGACGGSITRADARKSAIRGISSPYGLGRVVDISDNDSVYCSVAAYVWEHFANKTAPPESAP